MTIQNAIKSGKYFHRQIHGDDVFDVRNNRLWYGTLLHDEEPPYYSFYDPEYTGFENLNVEDILADDWEIVEVKETNTSDFKVVLPTTTEEWQRDMNIAFNQALEDFAGKILDWKPQDEEYRSFKDVVNEVKEQLRK